MIDVNVPLRTAYVTAFSGLTYDGDSVQTFYQNAPDNIEDDVMVILSPITSVDSSTKSSGNTETSMQVTIKTWAEKYNDGLAADNVAGQILGVIVPTPQAKLVLSAGYSSATQLVDDRTFKYKLQNQRNCLDRILIFRHQILHN